MSDDPLEALKDDPVTDAVHQPYSAFNQGHGAAEFGYAKRLNPYPEQTLEARWWDDGWDTYHGEGDYDGVEDMLDEPRRSCWLCGGTGVLPGSDGDCTECLGFA